MTPLDSLQAALLTTGAFSDVYLEESSGLSLHWEEGHLEDVSFGRNSGIGLRYMVGDETRYGYIDSARPITSTISPEEFQKLQHLSKELSHGLTHGPLKGADLPTSSGLTIQKSFTEIPLEKKVALLEAAFQSAQYHPLIRQVSIQYAEKTKNIAYVNSLGESCAEARVYLVFSVSVTAENNGLLQTASEVIGGMTGFELFDQSPVMQVARTAAERAIAKLQAPVALAGEMPVVIAASAGGTMIHEAIGHALEADHIQEGTAPAFSGKIGQVVASECVTVLDDPTRVGHRGSFQFDDEGIPAQKTILVDHGVLKTYLYDRHTAQKDNRPSNGHGRRESYAHKPIPRMSNTFVPSGLENPRDIICSIAQGLLVTRMGGGQVNTATGDFVFEIEEGFWIENGQVKHMVRGANLLGNGPEVLRSIDRVGNDMGWGIGTCGKGGQGVPVSDGLPTLRISKLLIGGAKQGLEAGG